MSKLKVYTGESGGYSPGAYYKEPELAVIDPQNDESMEKWAGVLNLSRKELQAAIEDFGPVVRNIRRGLLDPGQDEAA